MSFTPAANDVLLNTPTGWLYFAKPVKVLEVWQPSDVRPALREIERLVAEGGRYAAGFLSYEAALAFDPAHIVRSARPPDFPLLWFGIYREPQNVPARIFQTAASAKLPVHSWEPDLTAAPGEADLSQTGFGPPRHYQEAIEAIKACIAAGDTYQVNYTYRLRSKWHESAYTVFAALAAAHNPPYAAYLETVDWAVASLSPELFFTLDGVKLTGRPMKGTAPRGCFLEDDLAWAEWLYNSEKNRAENVMIVDMVRNDMGRIARTGSVRVPELFKIEKYPTVWQMTSTVKSETAAGLEEIFCALFPCASITGAPKIRTMQIIAELECSPRRIYTGAIGFFGPKRQAQFNVAIRTLRVDKRLGQAEYGVGGGIVWDSQIEEEWDETISKRRVLVELPVPFELFETMLWTPKDGWHLLDQHLRRLEHSAAYFDFSFARAAVQAQLDCLVEGFTGPSAQRVRLTLSKNGDIKIEKRTLVDYVAGIGDPGQRDSTETTGLGYNPAGIANPGYRITLAKTPVQSTNRFLYHKTTWREIYASRVVEVPEVEDVLLFNERGEVTESTIANLVYEMDSVCYTPPVECGLLPGTQRGALLQKGFVQLRPLKLDELDVCSRLWLVNSVRGVWEIELCAG